MFCPAAIRDAKNLRNDLGRRAEKCIRRPKFPCHLQPGLVYIDYENAIASIVAKRLEAQEADHAGSNHHRR